MCGIFAYKGKNEATELLINGLRKLEYRGYDSAGICEINKFGTVYLEKSIGRVGNLATKIENQNKNLEGFNTGIAHTRWATHGLVTEENTHPHYSNNERFFIVHNGIIENYIELKRELEEGGYVFYSETDSEIIAKLIELYYEDNLETTIKKVTKVLIGAYAIAVIDKENPDILVGVKIGSPLVLGFNNKDFFLSSDINALKGVCDSYIHIDDKEMVVISGDNYKITSSNSKKIKKEIKDLEDDSADISLGTFKHFMEKEIFEIPSIIENVLGGRVDFMTKEIKSNTLQQLDGLDIKNIEIIASGTSYNAGYTGTYWLEELAGIKSSITVSTEFKYKTQFIDKNTLYVFISQSGETADSLECLKAVKNKGGLTFGIVNVVGSSIATLSDMGLYTHSGTEIGVAASKTFIGQLGAILLMALHLGNKNNLEYIKYKNIIEGLKELNDDINNILVNNHKIKEISKKYSKYKNLFFLGRNYLYPAAMEGSLKCKEITYLHTEAYSAGELKHGPLSLIDEDFPTILINPKNKLYEKNISTLKEIKARKGIVIGVITKGDKYKDLYDDVIEIPETIPELTPFTTAVALQLFAYYMALDLGREIDKPRNLAKSVTVE